jgi:S-formylglutathione hydrolase FrmB
VLGIVVALGCGGFESPSIRFSVSLGEGGQAVGGGSRVYVLLTHGSESEPLFSPPWEQTVIGCDASDGGRGPWMLGDSDHPAPGPLSSLAPGEYSVRAVIDRDPTDWKIGWAEGNLYSSKQTVVLDPSKSTVIELIVENVVEAEPFVETETIRGVRLKSELVSAFAGEPRFLQAAVVLPDAYAESGVDYATVYVMPGWGGSHTSLANGDFQQRRYGMTGFGRDKIYVFLDHDMKYGAHCFANSDVVGPWGEALVRELIPYIELEYRVIPDGRARFLTGQSSGAWGSLWLQLTYPDSFAGAFAASPDFVDFRAFGDGLDLYGESANYFFFPDGRPRTGVRDPKTGEPLMTSVAAARWQAVARGADQLTSFEAVFGRPADTGEPEALVDRSSGSIDRRVLDDWARFDLARILTGRWSEIGSRVEGKLHIWVGENDDFLLDESVRLFDQELKQRGAKAHVEIISGAGHDVWTDDLRSYLHTRIDALVAEAGY